MAKKTSSNAIKKVNDQIKDLESKSKKVDTRSVKTSPVKKSTTKSSTVSRKTTKTKRETVIVAPTKKSRTTTAKKTTTSKNVRGGVVVPKKTVTKTIEKENIKNEINSLNTKKEKIEIVAPRTKKKKDLAKEVNKILDVDASKEEKSTVRTPKFIQDEKPKEDEALKKKEQQLKDFFVVEEKETPKSDITLDEVDVIKFDSKKKDTSSKKGSLKKRDNLSDTKILKIDKSAQLDQIDKIDEFNIVEDFKQDIPKRKKTESKKQDYSRKRKGKGFIVKLPKKPTFKELENDLRNLYDKVNDVVGDIDENVVKDETLIPKKKSRKKLDLSSLFKKKPKEKSVVKTKKVKVKPTEELLPGEKSSLLDYISQKVLNVFLAILFVIFIIMTIVFICFVIYVTTF
ncbi:MAG: hypothetical protein IKF71_02845 [Bacilli bacterium]|nr:hypothetical protein [Bacilli bacterium]